VDGFRIDAVSYLYETNYTSDEPESNIKGVTKDEHDYLIHTLTKDQPQTYNLVKSWRKILDDYAFHNNADEKVHLLLTSHIYQCNIFKFSNHKLSNYNIIFRKLELIEHTFLSHYIRIIHTYVSPSIFLNISGNDD